MRVGIWLVWIFDVAVLGIDNHTDEDYIGIRTCEIALKIIDAGLGEDEGRALEPLDNMAVAGVLLFMLKQIRRTQQGGAYGSNRLKRRDKSCLHVLP